MPPPFLGPGRWTALGLSLGFVLAGIAVVRIGSIEATTAGARFGSPEDRAFQPVSRMERPPLTAIGGPRVIVGDSLVWGWAGQPEGVYALRSGRAEEVTRLIRALPLSGDIQEAVIWLGNDDLARRWSNEGLVEEVGKLLDHLEPTRFVIVAPMPVWTKDTSITLHQTAYEQLDRRFPGRVVNPFPALQAALDERAPVYYDDFRLTAVGYAHVTNLVEQAFGKTEESLSPRYGIDEYGRMPTPMPAGLLESGSFLDLPR